MLRTSPSACECVCVCVCLCVLIFCEGILATLSYSGVLQPVRVCGCAADEMCTTAHTGDPLTRDGDRRLIALFARPPPVA